MSNLKEQKLVPLSYDFMFKALFGSEKNKHLLAFLINTLLNINIKEEDITIKNNEFIKLNKLDKKKTVDLIVHVKNIGYVNIEVNRYLDKTKLIRNESYALKAFSNQLTTETTYEEAERLIQINLNLKSIIKEPISIYHLKNQKGMKLNDLIEIRHINMEKIDDICYDEDVKKLIKIFISKEIKELKENTLYLGKLGEYIVEEVERLSEEEHIMGLYDKEKDDRMIAKSREICARKEGLARGIAQGISQGETKKSLSIATNMLKEKFSIEMISKLTGLSKSKIKSISL